VVRTAVPLLKALVGGRLAPAEPEAAAWVCSALARVCGRGSKAARAYALFVFKEGAPSPGCQRGLLPAACISRTLCPLPRQHFFGSPCQPLCQVAALRGSVKSVMPRARAVLERPRMRAGAAHVMKLLSAPATRLAAGPAALLAALLAAELPAAGRGRYAPPPSPPPLLRMSGLFAALGAAEHLRARLAEAAEYVQPRAGGAGAARPAVRLEWTGSRLRALRRLVLGFASR